jgi:DNA-binding GntR family transcriptional regulator
LSLEAFDDPVVFRVLQRDLGVRLDDVKLTIWAELADAEDAASLGCGIGAALLVTQLLYQDVAGNPVEVAYSRSLASALKLSTRLSATARDP